MSRRGFVKGILSWTPPFINKGVLCVFRWASVGHTLIENRHLIDRLCKVLRWWTKRTGLFYSPVYSPARHLPRHCNVCVCVWDFTTASTNGSKQRKVCASGGLPIPMSPKVLSDQEVPRLHRESSLQPWCSHKTFYSDGFSLSNCWTGGERSSITM